MKITVPGSTREISVAYRTVDRAIEYITAHPRQTVGEYADDLGIAETTLHVIIGVYLMDVVNDGAIAVSPHGSKPNWFYAAEDQSRIPVRPTMRSNLPVALPDIKDEATQEDYIQLINIFQRVNGRRVSPKRRQKAEQEFIERIKYVGTAHQEALDEIDFLNDENDEQRNAIADMTAQMKGIRADVRMLASAVASASLAKSDA